MNIDRSPEDIIILQETTEGDEIYNRNNKRKPDGQLKEPDKKQYHLSCIRLVHETYRIRKWNKPSHHGSIRSQMSSRLSYYS